jgi:hypothetical protein
VATDDDAKTTVAELHGVKAALMAELTWAKLYTKAMHKELAVISTSISKSRTTTPRPEMTNSAERLHDQLESANHTVGELSDHAGPRLVPVKR